MRFGVRLGLDLGTRRIGVARSDRDGSVVVPVGTLTADSEWFRDVAEMITKYDILEIVIGLPVSLRGEQEIAAEQMWQRIRDLQTRLPDVPIRVVDERLSSATANRRLREAGHDAKSSRALVDAIAAAELLEFALETERRTGKPAGEKV